MNPIPDWAILLLMKPTIRNESLESCQTYFNNSPVFLNNYDLVCVGQKGDKQKYYVYIQILASHSNLPLNGPHKITAYCPTLACSHTFWVSSLTTLKKKVFGFTDRLSFERSTYLLLYTHQKIIRLKNIRGNIHLPCEMVTMPICIGLGTFSNTQLQITKEKKRIPSARTLQQASSLLRTILTAFQRDLHGSTSETIFQLFEKEVSLNLQDLNPSK